MQFRISPHHRLSIDITRIYPRHSYTPIQIDQGHLKKLSSVPYFMYQRDSTMSDDVEVATMVIDKLKAEGLYRDNLLFAGFRGVYLYKNGSFGKRKRTFAVTEKAFYRSVSEKWRYRQYVNSPFLHMDVAGKSMPALGVFDASTLIGGSEFDEYQEKLPEHEKIAWWTADGSSIDTAAIAIFFFKRYDAYDEIYGSQSTP
jgi:hypothetical protein